MKSNDNPKLGKNKSKQEYVTFCFKHLTTNNTYRFKSISNYREKCKAFEELFKKIDEIQNTPWIDFGMRSRNSGYEMLRSNSVYFNPKNEEQIKSEKYISIRFAQNKYRIIAIKSKNKPVLHIIGFDLNYNAYNHGS